MAYTPTTWTAGQVLTSSGVNKLETGLQGAAASADDLQARFGVTAKSLGNGFDLNTLTVSGQYCGQPLTNAPTTEWYYVEVIRHAVDANWCLQRITGYTGIDKGKVYQRRKDNDIPGWTGWTLIADSSGAIDPYARLQVAPIQDGGRLAPNSVDKAATDVNTLTTNGWYLGGSAATNQPGTGRFVLFVSTAGSGYVHQRLLGITGAIMYQEYVRAQTGGPGSSWTAWTLVADATGAVDTTGRAAAVQSAAVAAGQVFLKDGSGNVAGTGYGSAVSGSLIVQRTSTGDVAVPASPSSGNSAVARAYVETATADLVDNGRWGKSVKDISNGDINAITDTGIYRGANLTNSPSTSVGYFVENMSWNGGNFTFQRLISYTGTYAEYARSKSGSTWTGWTQTVGSGSVIDSIARAPLGTNGRLGVLGSGIANTDLNALLTQGFYSGSTLANSPTGDSRYFYVFVQMHVDNTWGVQWATEYADAGGAGYTNPRTWRRLRQGTVWQTWTLMADSTGAIDQGARTTAAAAVPTATASAGQAFVKNGSNVLTGLAFTPAATGGTLVQRNGDGTATAATPTAATHLATKAYVDSIPMALIQKPGLDFNTVTTTGNYEATGNPTAISNSPDNRMGWVLMHYEATTGGGAYQKAVAPAFNASFERFRSGTTWTQWLSTTQDSLMGLVYNAIANAAPHQITVAAESNSSNQQFLANGTWQRINFQTVTADGSWSSADNWYTIPYDGVYQVNLAVRPNDGAFTTTSAVGLGVGTTQTDGANVYWYNPGAFRNTFVYSRQTMFYAGAQVRAFCYTEGKPFTLTNASFGLSLVKEVPQNE